MKRRKCDARKPINQRTVYVQISSASMCQSSFSYMKWANTGGNKKKRKFILNITYKEGTICQSRCFVCNVYIYMDNFGKIFICFERSLHPWVTIYVLNKIESGVIYEILLINKIALKFEYQFEWVVDGFPASS